MAMLSPTSWYLKRPRSCPSWSPLQCVASQIIHTRYANSQEQLKSALATVVFSIPSPVRALRRANLVINTLLLLATAEFVFFPYFDSASDVVFTRVGALYPDSAKIVVRYPSTNATENLVRVVWSTLR